MGADMIGYLVKGPRKIDKDSIERAATHLLNRSAALNSGLDVSCPICDAAINKAALEENGGRCPNCDSTAYVPALEGGGVTTIAAARKCVKTLVADWPPDYRDVASRFDPDDREQLLVFAGDMSWGDSPGGAGYEYLERLLGSGVAEILGVR